MGGALMRRAVFLWTVAVLVLTPGLSRALEVASLHPLMTDLARRIGGDRITVVELIGSDDNPHEFDPSPRAFAAAADARLIIASGKGLEASYLGKLRDTLRPNQEIFEAGRRVHSLVAAEGNPAACCAHHTHTGVIDPHWWHEPTNMSRAGRDLAEKLGRIDPANAEFYEANAEAFAEEMALLDEWIRARVARIPRARRILATSHLAFGYFCRAYDWTAVAIQGLNREDSASSRGLGEIVAYLREEKVPALFPETGSNPKSLEVIADDLDIALGQPLYADGTGLPEGKGYEYMMRSNVEAIVGAIARKDASASAGR
ncbi:MAG: metal ABC transporter substrate-binding protein [Puniceicoccaceae bacterium]